MIRRVGIWSFRGFLVLLIVALSVYWWRYGRSEKAMIKIPKTANALISIDLRKMEQTVFWDAIYHPLAYWDDASDDGDDDDTPSMGFSYPKRITFFVMEGADDAFFSQPIAIKSKDFQQYVDTLVRRDEWELLGRNFIFDTQKQLFYLWDASRVGVAFAKRAQADFVQTTLGNLLKEQDGDILSDDLSEKINQGEHHFVIWRKQSEWTQNEPVVLYGYFEKGAMVIQGEISSNYSFLEKNEFFENTDTDILTVSMNLNKNNFSFSESLRRSFQKTTHLELDSFFRYSTGEINLKVPRMETQIDSIITYEYDDDFNKVEKVSTQEIVAPEIIAQLANKKNELYGYFRRRGVVKDLDEKSRFVGLPFVEMDAIAKGEQLFLTTGATNEKVQIDTNFLKINVNCSQYPQMLKFLPFQVDSTQFAKLDGLLLCASQKSPSPKIKLLFKLIMKNQQRNMLGVLATMR